MKTITKIMNLKELEKLSQIHLKTPIDINELYDGFDLHIIFERIAQDNNEIKELMDKYLIVNYNSNTQDIIVMKKSYIKSELDNFTKYDIPDTLKSTFIQFGAIDSILKYQNEINISNKATNDDMEQYKLDRDLMIVKNDIDSCGLVEMYFEEVEEFLNTITILKNRTLTLKLLDFVLDCIVEIYPKETYFAYRKTEAIKDLEQQVATFIQKAEVALGIDRLSNREQIQEFIVADIIEVTNVTDYNDSDISIAFRRFLERDC